MSPLFGSHFKSLAMLLCSLLHLLFNPSEPLNGLGNEIQILNPNRLSLDVTPPVLVTSVVVAVLDVAVEVVFGISARAVDAASLVDAMRHHLAFALPAACSFCAFLAILWTSSKDKQRFK